MRGVRCTAPGFSCTFPCYWQCCDNRGPVMCGHIQTASVGMLSVCGDLHCIANLGVDIKMALQYNQPDDPQPNLLSVRSSDTQQNTVVIGTRPQHSHTTLIQQAWYCTRFRLFFLSIRACCNNPSSGSTSQTEPALIQKCWGWTLLAEYGYKMCPSPDSVSTD